MQNNNSQVRSDMDLDEFEAAVDAMMKVVTATVPGTPRDKTRSHMLKRFQSLNGLGSTAEAEKLLADRKAALAVPVAPPPAPAPAVKAAPKRPSKTAPDVELTPIQLEAEDVDQAVAQVRRQRKAAAATDDGLPYFWIKPQDAAFLDMWPDLRRNDGAVANLLITGPSGSGKTEMVKRVAQMKGIPFYKVDCSSITSPDKWVGFKEVDEKGTHYILSEHLRWVQAKDVDPGIVLYDDFTRLHPSMHNVLIPLLDGSQSIWVPDLGINIDVHPETMFCATANIGSGFSGTYRMDDAIEQRFGYRVEQGFPPVDEEIKILMNRTGISQQQAKVLADIGASTRQKAATADLSKSVSTRNLLDAATLVAAGMSIPDASEFTFVKMFSDEGAPNSERVMVRMIAAGKGGQR